jgi:hypothetical protein
VDCELIQDAATAFLDPESVIRLQIHERLDDSDITNNTPLRNLVDSASEDNKVHSLLVAIYYLATPERIVAPQPLAPQPLALQLTASGGGDPYLYPLYGPAVKLPNVEAIYRLYEDDAVVVNARVQRASPAIQQQIKQLMRPFGLRVVSAEAYFFSHIFIGSRQIPTDQVTVDLETRQSSGTLSRVGPAVLDTTKVPYDVHATSSVSIPIHWGPALCLRINFSRNPQVRNGLSLTGDLTGTGLLMRNFRPKFFVLDRLDDTRMVAMPRNVSRLLTHRGVKATNELEVKIVPCR